MIKQLESKFLNETAQQGGITHNIAIHSGTMELLKVVMLVNGFVHFTMALSIEGVHKGNTAKKQQNFINYNNDAQFMNELVIVCIILYFHCFCLLMPCILHLYHPCLCTFPVYPCLCTLPVYR